MAIWTIKPEEKKSLTERNHLYKDENHVIIETGWRWGEFTIETEDDEPPVLEMGVDLYNCDYDVELVETIDSCWDDVDMEECDEETKEWLEEFFNDGNDWLELEDNGWTQTDSEMIVNCGLIIEDADGNVVSGSEVEDDEDDDYEEDDE